MDKELPSVYYGPITKPSFIVDDDKVTEETWTDWVEWKLTELRQNDPDYAKKFGATLRSLKARLNYMLSKKG